MEKEQTAQQAMERVLGFTFVKAQWELACATREASNQILRPRAMSRAEPFAQVPGATERPNHDR